MPQEQVRSPTEFEREVIAAGWGPLNPSPECIAATARPPMPVYLTETDRRGIHMFLLDTECLRRFESARSESTPRGQIEAFCLMHALRAGGADLVSLGEADLRRMIRTMAGWSRDIFTPAQERLTAAFGSEMSNEEIQAQWHILEPALTHAELQLAMNTTDWEGNRKAAVEGMKLGERRGVLKKHAQQAADDVHVADFRDEDLGGLLQVLTSKNPGQHLFHVTDELKFCLGPREVRDALESVLTPVEPIREERGSELADGVADARHDAAPAPAEAAAQAEQAVMISHFIRARRDQAQPGTAEHVVIENWERLVEDDTSIRQLAKDSGLSRQMLSRARATLSAALLRELRIRKRS